MKRAVTNAFSFFLVRSVVLYIKLCKERQSEASNCSVICSRRDKELVQHKLRNPSLTLMPVIDVHIDFGYALERVVEVVAGLHRIKIPFPTSSGNPKCY